MKVRVQGFKLGITGGIGSGKTSVCRVFGILGIPVFSADLEARMIMEQDTKVKSRVNSITGRDLYIDGRLDRNLLASIIFNDKALLEKVNSLVHPIVIDRFYSWVSDQKAPYIIMEAAILFESGAFRIIDRVVTVIAPTEERIERIMLRNNMSREQVIERIKNQIDDDARIKLSDYVINNSENDLIIPEILKIHNEILAITKN